MLNLSFISLISFILIYQNIIILNEETLILLCFITFCWIAFNRLSESIFNDLKNRSHKIENSLTNSLDRLLETLFHSIELQNKFQSLSLNFKVLGNHFLEFGYAVSNKLPNYSIQKFETTYPKKLIFTQHLEQQTTKLLALLLGQKLSKITSIQKFYTHKLKISSFLCINKVILHGN